MANLNTLWEMVNNSTSIAQCNQVESVIRTNVINKSINNEQFDDLMMALTYIHREINRDSRKDWYRN